MKTFFVHNKKKVKSFSHNAIDMKIPFSFTYNVENFPAIINITVGSFTENNSCYLSKFKEKFFEKSL